MSDQLKATSSNQCYTPAYPTNDAPSCEQSTTTAPTCTPPQNQSLPESQDTLNEQSDASSTLNKQLNLNPRKPERQPKNQPKGMSVRELQGQKQAQLVNQNMERILGDMIAKSGIGPGDCASEKAMHSFVSWQLKGAKVACSGKDGAFLFNHPKQLDAKIRSQLQAAGLKGKALDDATTYMKNEFKTLFVASVNRRIRADVESRIDVTKKAITPLINKQSARVALLVNLAESGKSSKEMARVLVQCGVPEQKAAKMAGQLFSMDKMMLGCLKRGEVRGESLKSMDMALKKGAVKFSKSLDQLKGKLSSDHVQNNLLSSDFFGASTGRVLKSLSINPKATNGVGKVIGEEMKSQKSKAFWTARGVDIINGITSGPVAVVMQAGVTSLVDADKQRAARTGFAIGTANQSAVLNADEDAQINRLFILCGLLMSKGNASKVLKNDGTSFGKQALKGMVTGSADEVAKGTAAGATKSILQGGGADLSKKYTR